MPFHDDQNPIPREKDSCINEIKQTSVPCCIEAPVILGQVKTRKCITRNIALLPGPGNDHPSFSFKGADGFKIVELRALDEIPCNTSNIGRVDVFIVIRYNLMYSDGLHDLMQTDEACFELPIDHVRIPDSKVKIFHKYDGVNPFSKSYTEKSYFTADALAETFGDVICPFTGALILDLGVFFIIKSQSTMALSIPSFSGCIPCLDRKT